MTSPEPPKRADGETRRLLVNMPGGVDPIATRTMRRNALTYWRQCVHPVVKLNELAKPLDSGEVSEPDGISIVGSCFSVQRGILVTSTHVLHRHFPRWEKGLSPLSQTEQPFVAQLIHIDVRNDPETGRNRYASTSKLHGIGGRISVGEKDVSIVRVTHDADLGIAPLATEDPMEGDPVFTVGFPFGGAVPTQGPEERYYFPAFTSGILSKIIPVSGRPFQQDGRLYSTLDRYLTDAAIESGMSGGPLVDWETHRVIGVIIERLTQPVGQANVSLGFGSVIPIASIRIALHIYNEEVKAGRVQP